MKHVPIIDSFRFAFLTYKKSFHLVFTIALINAVLSLSYELISHYFTGSTPGASYEGQNSLIFLTFSLVSIIIAFVLHIIYIKIGIQAYNTDSKLTFQNIKLPSVALAWHLFLVMLVYSILISLGFVLFIFPGTIIAICYMFVDYIMIEHHLPVKKVFRISEKLTEGIKWKLLGYLLLVSLLFSPIFYVSFNKVLSGVQSSNHVVTLLTLLMVLLITPITTLSGVYIYKHVQDQQQSIDQPHDPNTEKTLDEQSS